MANRGKTRSIRKAYELLKHAYPDAQIEEGRPWVEVTVVMTINGVKVGIESQGDPSSRLPESLARFVRIGCKVIICACRTTGQTTKRVTELGDRYTIRWLDKPDRVPADHEAANSATAREILTLAQAALAESQ